MIFTIRLFGDKKVALNLYLRKTVSKDGKASKLISMLLCRRYQKDYNNHKREHVVSDHHIQWQEGR